jgi:hypothetical protein
MSATRQKPSYRILPVEEQLRQRAYEERVTVAARAIDARLQPDGLVKVREGTNVRRVSRLIALTLLVSGKAELVD